MLMPGSHPRSTISRPQMEPLERKSLQLAGLSGGPNTSQGTQFEDASRSAFKFPAQSQKQTSPCFGGFAKCSQSNFLVCPCHQHGGMTLVHPME